MASPPGECSASDLLLFLSGLLQSADCSYRPGCFMVPVEGAFSTAVRRPVALHDSHELVEQLAGGKFIGVKAFDGRKLQQIEADNLSLPGDGFKQGKGLVPAEPAGNRCACGGKDARIQAVDVDCK